MTWIRENLLRVMSIACLVVAAVWFVILRLGGPSGANVPPPTLPAQLEQLDPDVAALIRRTADAVAGDTLDADRWVELGMVYEANGLFRYAVAAYAQAVALRDDDPRVWYRLGAAQERVGDLEPAIDAMRRAVALDDAMAEVQWQLGSWLLDTGRLDEAEQHLGRASALAPGDQRPWFGLVRLALARRQADEAIALVDEHGLRSGPYASYAWRLLGQAHRLRGETDAAEAALARGGTDAPSFPTVRVQELMPYRTGVVAARQDVQRLLAEGRRADARRALERLHELDPDDTGALIMLAQLDFQERQPDRAVARLEQALTLVPDEFTANLHMANVLLVRGAPGDIERGLGHIDRAVAARPLDPQARNLKGRLLVRAGRGPEAVDMLKAAHRANTSGTGLLALAGAIEVQLGRWPDAIATMKAVLAKRPGDAHALMGLARAHVELGEIDDARAALDALAPDAPVDPRAVDALRQRIESPTPEDG